MRNEFLPSSTLALERGLPSLQGKLHRVALASLPTRVHRLSRLEAELGAASLWVKRDDESCSLYGGNKPRKLEFLLAEALRSGKKTVLTTGGIGTHHGLATALCARALGLHTILLLLKQPVTASVRKSLLLDFAAGAEMHYAPSVPRLTARGLRVVGRAMWQQELPYIIPTGGTSVLGTLGYVNAAFELREQITAGELPEPDYIFLPVGSGGTYAGLVLGAKFAGLRCRVVGVMVTDILAPGPVRLARMANKTLHYLRSLADVPNPSVGRDDFPIVDGYIGPGYGATTDSGRAARDRLERLEGIHLDTTYTAKCLAALIDAVRAPPYRQARVLFWNTYNSVDVEKQIGPLPDYRALPEEFHRFFIEPAQD